MASDFLSIGRAAASRPGGPRRPGAGAVPRIVAAVLTSSEGSMWRTPRGTNADQPGMWGNRILIAKDNNYATAEVWNKFDPGHGCDGSRHCNDQGGRVVTGTSCGLAWRGENRDRRSIQEVDYGITHRIGAVREIARAGCRGPDTPTPAPSRSRRHEISHSDDPRGGLGKELSRADIASLDEPVMVAGGRSFPAAPMWW